MRGGGGGVGEEELVPLVFAPALQLPKAFRAFRSFVWHDDFQPTISIGDGEVVTVRCCWGQEEA